MVPAMDYNIRTYSVYRRFPSYVLIYNILTFEGKDRTLLQAYVYEVKCLYIIAVYIPVNKHVLKSKLVNTAHFYV
jgi:hypothetical protein